DFKLLIKKHKAEVNSKNGNGKTALHWAAKKGYTSIAETLLKYKAQVDTPDNDRCTSLFYAAKAGHDEVINILINHGADINHVDKNGKTALHEAASYGHQNIIKILLEKNANINAVSNNNWTLLHFAATAGHVEVIKTLLEQKCKINTTDKDSKTALDLAAENKHVEAVKYLLKAEASADKDFNEQYFNHIYFAAKKNYVNVVKLLLEKETDINLRLPHTAGKEDIQIIKLLLENGENNFDINGSTPLHWAALEGHKEIVKYLIEKNDSLVNMINENSETALHEAAWNGHREIVEFLLDHGANINFKNKNDWKPLHIAAISCQIEVFKLLRNKEEDSLQVDKIFDQLDDDQLNNYFRFKLTYNSVDVTLKLVEKFQSLEKQFKLKSISDIEFISFYQFFIKRIEQYAENLENKEIKMALSYLYTCTLSKICTLKFQLESNLIVNINGYFKMIKKDIELLKNEETQRRVEEFKKEIKIKVEEAYNIASKQIKHEMDNIIHKIDEKIKILINETKELIENVEENKHTLEEKQNELKNKLVLRQTLGILKIVGQTISIAGGPIGVAGDVIKGGVNIAEAFISENNRNSNFEISSDIKDSLNRMEKMIEDEEIKKKEIKIAEQQIKELSQECDKYPYLSNIKGSLIKIQKSLSNINSTKIIKEIKVELETTQKKLEELEKENNEDSTIELEVVHKLNIAINTTEMAIELYNKYQKDKEEIDAISNSIKQAENDIKKLKRYEENINNAIVPMIKRMQDDINNIESKINKRSHVFLDVTKWKVQSSLKDIKHEIRQISKGFKIQEDVTRYMEMLDEGLTTLINIYDRIQDYYDQAKLVYIAHIGSSIADKIADEKLDNAVNKLKREIRFNIILRHLKRATNAFKQWVFPFANVYSDILISPDDYHYDIDIDKSINYIESQIKNIHSKVQEGDVYIIKDIDNYLKYGEFHSEKISTEPFFVWENNKYSHEISKLLIGEEVTIKADITKIDSNKSNSYYRYGDKFYVIRSDKQPIGYGFEKNDKGEPVMFNNTYKKIKEGELMLSPYTMWKIKLTPAKKNYNFNKFKIYEGKIDLELIGRGKYVNENDSNLMVENYYEEYEYKNHETI
ncbi:4170_t:CDS:2, partial [Scutellospora calospora]